MKPIPSERRSYSWRLRSQEASQDSVQPQDNLRLCVAESNLILHALSASAKVFDAAVAKTSGGKRSIVWREVLAGEKSFNQNGNWLPEETVAVIREHRVAIKGPLTTPVGGGIRSLNVALRQLLDLYACIRPVRWFQGVPAPVKHPEKLNVVIFRENIEDVYAGIEFQAESKEANALISLLEGQLGKKVRAGSAIGVKELPSQRMRSPSPVASQTLPLAPAFRRTAFVPGQSWPGASSCHWPERRTKRRAPF